MRGLVIGLALSAIIWYLVYVAGAYAIHTYYP